MAEYDYPEYPEGSQDETGGESEIDRLKRELAESQRRQAELEEAARRASAGYSDTGTSGTGTGTGTTSPTIAKPRWQRGGIDEKKWLDPNHNTPKYQVLRIADEVSPAELRAQFKARKGAQYDKIRALGFEVDSDDKIVRSDLNGGRGIDIIHGDNEEYGWNEGNKTKDPKGDKGPIQSIQKLPPSTGGGNTGGTGGTKIPESFYEAPEDFTYENFVAPEFNRPEFVAPSAFEYPEYVLPSGEEVLNRDPGYALRQKEGQRALTNMAAAKGLLKSGATLKGIMDWSQGLASQEYGQAVDRDFTVHQSNRNNAADDYDRLWKNKLTTYGLDYGAETDEYNRALSTWDTNFGKAATDYGFALDVAAGKAGGKQGAASLAGNLQLGNRQIDLSAQNSLWDRLMQLYNATRPASTAPTSSSTYGYTSNTNTK